MTLIDNLDTTSLHLLHAANTLVTRQHSTSNESRPASYKAIGLSLAIASGAFIGTSFVLKKVGLLKANEKYNEEAGEGYGYLKNVYWWGGMTLMIIGEVCNFVAYAFTDAILVTPLGALSVVITTILSAIFLKERLSFVGKVGCFNCIVGSVVIVVNAPQQSAVADIQQMKSFVIAPGFLSYAGVIVLGSIFIAFWVGPRYGKKSMFVYLSICSFIGGLSVVATQGLGAAVVAQASKGNQFNQWFLYVLLVFVVATLLTEIVYLNKALNIFNAALVTPTYYVFFTSTTIITSAILFRGFHGTGSQIATVVMGFLQICAGVVLLQLSKSAKDVPDAAIFKGDLDQVREVAAQEHPESEPKADAIRGTASIIRRFSTPRRTMEQLEARRFREEKLAEALEPLKENEVAEWDGLRRRKTIIGVGPTSSSVSRRKTIHPPLGMAYFPEESSPEVEDNKKDFFEAARERAHTMFQPRDKQNDSIIRSHDDPQSPVHPVALTDIRFPKGSNASSPIVPYGPGSLEEAQERIYGHPVSSSLRPMPSPRSKPLPASPMPSDAGVHESTAAKRQFSFSNFLKHPRRASHSTDGNRTRSSTTTSHPERKATKNATEEERLGLVVGDSSRPLMSDSSPELKKATVHVSPELHAPHFDGNYPYTQSKSQRQHRSASPDAMSDDDRLQPRKQRIHFSSAGPSPGTTTPQATSSRQRPTPPLARPMQGGDTTHSADRVPQVSTLQPSTQTTSRHITIGYESPQASRSAPSLEPPPQFTSSSRQPRQQGSPSAANQSSENITASSSRGRPTEAEALESQSQIRSDGNQNSSKERYAEQSARERAERRERSQRRQSQGPSGERQSTDLS